MKLVMVLAWNKYLKFLMLCLLFYNVPIWNKTFASDV